MCISIPCKINLMGEDHVRYIFFNYSCTYYACACLLVHNFSIGNSIKEIRIVFYEMFVTDGSMNRGNVLLLGFLLLLGMMTAFFAVSGGSKAFGHWMIKRIKPRTGAKLMTAVLGLIIFIDD